MLKKSLLFLFTILPPIVAFGEITVNTNFKGGNATIASIEGDTIRFSPDIRDSSKKWFYWNFAVQNVGGHTLQLVSETANIGTRGPGVSLDKGVTWKWIGANAVKPADSDKESIVTYSVPEGVEEVRFSVGMPYTSEQLDTFLEKYKGNPSLKIETLTKSNKGREVPLLQIGNPNAPYTVGITARAHSSEMMGSRILEGILAGILAEDEQGAWLRENVDFFIVPFLDMDGVEDGDQGKNRTPHDHNRDFGDDTIYPEVMAIKDQLPKWSKGRPLIYLDIHDPALKNDIHEVIQYLTGTDEAQNAHFDTFLAAMTSVQQGLILNPVNPIMKFGTGFNRLSENPPPHGSGWARTLENTLFSVTLEFPYSNASGYEANMDSTREYGIDIAWGFQKYLQNLQLDPNQ